MKKLSLLLLSVMLSGGVAFADNGQDSHLFGLKDEVQAVGIDAPNLVKFNDWGLGAEMTKQTNYTASDEGYSFLLKATYHGSLFDFSPKNV